MAEDKTPSPRTALFEALNRQAAIIRAQDAQINGLSTIATVQDQRIATLEQQIAFTARALDTEKGRKPANGLFGRLASIARPGLARIASLTKQADERNPAQPVPQPAGTAPVVTTDQTRAEDIPVDVTQLGASPITDVSADAVTDVNQPYGTMAFEPLNLSETDVTAPVAGTEVMRPPAETVTEVEVRIGNPDNPVPAYGWTIDSGPEYGSSAGTAAPVKSASVDPKAHFYASLRLARLQIEAGIAETDDDLALGERIAASGRSVEEIRREAEVLSRVAKANTAPAVSPQQARRLVPRAALRTERQAPAVAPQSTAPIPSGQFHVAMMQPSDEEFFGE